MHRVADPSNSTKQSLAFRTPAIHSLAKFSTGHSSKTH